MASQWRIRHKLMLGLVLVVGIMALLLGGTLHGLLSYYDTINFIRGKHAELKPAEELKSAIANLLDLVDRPDSLDPIRAAPVQPAAAAAVSGPTKPKTIKEAVEDARLKLTDYEKQLDETAHQGYYDPVKEEHARGLISALTEHFHHLDNAIHETMKPQVGVMANDDDMFKKKLGALREQVKVMADISSDLRNDIYVDLQDIIAGSRRHYQIALWMIIPASVLSLLLVCSLAWACRAWVVYPIRELEAGVLRVARGDFEHSIEVRTGDEMQDLAEAFNDMTRRLQALYNDLARQVNERSRQLVRSEKLASVGFLAAGVAHEINNPLASIAFCSEALEARLESLMRRLPTSVKKGDDLEVFTRYLKMIQEEAFRCKTITEKLLDFSRGGEKRRESTDLEQLIQSVLDITQHLQNSKGKRIVFESQTERMPGGRITAAVNAEEIKSVVLNLVVNALDSLEDGGQLTIRLSRSDGMAQMEFIDSGCGMTQEVLENIFEPFFTRSRTGKGTGLGLTISHRIINQHGGEIEAASSGHNKGSTFTVRLPVQVVERSELPLAA